MQMIYLLPALILLLVILGPGLWVRAVMRRYHLPADRYPQSGVELASWLLAKESVTEVGVEKIEAGDHYDPIARMVRLSQENYDGHSITALAVAAHEVGHALQHARGYSPLIWRTRLVRALAPLERLGAGLLLAAPLALILTRVPLLGAASFLGGLLSLGSAVAIHAVTLPTEFNASFARALPLLKTHQLLHPDDLPKARRVLFAAALTYVAASLMSLLNIARWWAILRR